jgi:hypothetical protein
MSQEFYPMSTELGRAIRRALDATLDSRFCFMTNECDICGNPKPQSKIICDECNEAGLIKLGIYIKNHPEEFRHKPA